MALFQTFIFPLVFNCFASYWRHFVIAADIEQPLSFVEVPESLCIINLSVRVVGKAWQQLNLSKWHIKGSNIDLARLGMGFIIWDKENILTLDA